MKKLEFNINELGQTEVGMVNIPGEIGDGSAIRVTNQVLDDCIKAGIANGKKVVCARGRGTKNIYYDFGDKILVKLSAEDDEVVIFDKKLIGKDLSEVFEGKSMCINRGTNSRGICRMCLPKVKHKDYKGNVVVSDNYPVAVTTIIWLLKQGTITVDDLHSKTAKVVDIIDNETHHILADWDNRIDSTSLLTEDGHKKVHYTEGQYSHQLIANPKYVEEVVALLDYVDNYTL